MIPSKPHNVIWSDEQWEAIYQSGNNILVSAGAGSGKTAVLSERIIEKLKQGIKLDSLIVLTFTKAAANEMKERIRLKIIEAIREGYDLTEQLDYIDQSNIQTFDAFSLSLVRKYHYKLGISRDINIGDKVVLMKAKQDILDKVFGEYYDSSCAVFTNFLSEFTTKDDENIKKSLLDIINRIDLLPEKNKFLENYHEVFFNEEFIRSNIKKYLILLQEYQEKIRLRLDKLGRLISDDLLIENLQELTLVLEPLLNSQSYNDFVLHANVKFPRLPSKADEEEKKIFTTERDYLDKDLKSIQELLSYSKEAEMLEEILDLEKYTSLLIDIINKFYSQYDEFKKEHNIYEFLDIAKMGIKLLTEDEELRQYLKESTHEILIDEYQDTSDIQELFISLIANNNVYMVGDIKQSIYRFRNANPNIFKTKYELYSQNQGGLLINLYKNFRSRQEVLSGINHIFERVMCANLGGVNYDKNQRLEFGNLNYAKNCFNASYDLQVLTYKKDEQFSKYNTSEIEAFIIANDIKNKIANNYLIFDKNKSRPVRYSDFTILTATKTKFDTYKKIFEYLQIPLVVHKEDSFVSSDEIYVIKNILICINSFKHNTLDSQFKAALISVLRSFIIELDDEVISKIYNGNIKSNLKLEYEELYNKFYSLSIITDIVPLDELLLKIYQDFSIYPQLVKIGDVDRLEDKLNFLAGKAKELSLLGYSLEDFINYFEWIINNGLDIEFNQALNSDDNVVNLMSIHKSKGLEYPICYFPELSTRFNLQELNDRFMFSADYGFIIPIFNEGVKDTFYKALIKSDYRLEEISERIRLFYVALTRAKEQIILILPEKDDLIQEDYSIIHYVDRLNYRSFADILYSIDFGMNKFKRKIYLENLELTQDYIFIKPLNTLENNKKYPTIDFLELSLRRKETALKIASRTGYKILSKTEHENIELGIKLHRYFELIDFLNPIEEQINLIDESASVKQLLYKFFNHSLIKNLNLIRTFHEHSFSYKSGEEVRNGVIDLILETHDELIIIDYKLLDIDSPYYHEQLMFYFDYLTNVSRKTISGYLYSIINSEFKKVF